MAKGVIVVGGGKVGAYLAALLAADGHRVAVLERDVETAAALRERLPSATVVQGSGTDPSALDRARIDQSDVLAAVTGSDETNLVATSLARFEFGVKRTVARVKDPRNAWMFTPVMGVDVAVNQSDLLGHLIALETSLIDVMTLLRFTGGDFSLVAERVSEHSPADGHALRELDLPRQCLLTGLIRAGEFILPKGDTVLRAGDEVLAVVHVSMLGQLSQTLSRAAGRK